MTKVTCTIENGIYCGRVIRGNSEKFCIVSRCMNTVLREMRIYLGVKTLVDFT